MKEWTVKFWTPGSPPRDDGKTFGCAVHGFCTPTRWVSPDAGRTARWAHSPKGEVVRGTYDGVMKHLNGLKGAGFRPSAAVCLFARNSGVERFVDSCREILAGVPMAGGVAALGRGRTSGEVLPEAEDAAVMLLGGDGYEVEAMNAHDPKGVDLQARGGGGRIVESVRVIPGGEWMSALDYYSSVRESERVPADDFECVTFSGLAGVNVHCSPHGGGLKTGADLPEDGMLVLRGTDPGRVTARLGRWVAAPDSLVFCCAGLRRLVRTPLRAGRGTLAGFMFGELVTTKGVAAFGNLMTARLRVTAGA